MVLAVARRVARSRDDADDIAQEVFLRFYRAIDRVDPERPLEPWLVRLTVNAARTQVARRPQRREDELDESTADPGRGPAAAVVQRQLREALNTAVGTLPEREREVFLLRDLEGLDAAVVAEALGISEITVRRQSCEARKKVAAWFRAHRPELI